MIYNYDNFLLEQVINEAMLNEKLDLEKIKNFINQFGNKEQAEKLIVELERY